MKRKNAETSRGALPHPQEVPAFCVHASWKATGSPAARPLFQFNRNRRIATVTENPHRIPSSTRLLRYVLQTFMDDRLDSRKAIAKLGNPGQGGNRATGRYFMSSEGSISQWIAALKAGERRAVQELWNRYRDRLLEMARRRLGKAPKRVGDEEDIAQSVLLSLYRGATEGRFEDVRNRDDLWWLLLAITRQKSVDFVRRETAKKRGGGRVRSEESLVGHAGDSRQATLDEIIGSAPTPDLLAMMEEQSQRLLGSLRDDRLRRIAISRIEGYTVEEIAVGLAVSTRSVERKLQLIRHQWTKELARARRAPDAI